MTSTKYQRNPVLTIKLQEKNKGTKQEIWNMSILHPKMPKEGFSLRKIEAVQKN